MCCLPWFWYLPSGESFPKHPIRTQICLKREVSTFIYIFLFQCFSVGAEIGNHRNDHPYSLVDHCAASIFGGRGAWTGKEQLLLLDAVEHYGFGTWELVSEHVETRTAEGKMYFLEVSWLAWPQFRYLYNFC